MWPGSNDDSEDEGVSKATSNMTETKVLERTGEIVELWDYPKIMKSVSTEILPNIYIGNKDNGEDLKQLNHKNAVITHLVNVSRDGKKPHDNRANANGFDFYYHVINIEDSPSEDISGLFMEFINFVEEAYAMTDNPKILVYTEKEGGTAPAAFVIGYLIAAKKLTFAQAAKKITEARDRQGQKKYAPNHGFIRQIKQFEKDLATTKNPEKNVYLVRKKSSKRSGR